jgi:hypothetical protein
MKTLTCDSITVVMTMPSGDKIELKPCTDSIEFGLPQLEFSTNHLADFKANYERHNKAMAKLDALVGIVPPKLEGE